MDDDLSVPIAAVATSIKVAQREIEVVLDRMEKRYEGRGNPYEWPDYNAAFALRAYLRDAAEMSDRLKKLEGCR